MSYVYRRLNNGKFEVGYWGPHFWELESEHLTAADAAARVSYLNGGREPALAARLAEKIDRTYSQHLADLGRAIAEGAAVGCPCLKNLADSLLAFGYELPVVDVEPEHTI